MKILPLLLGGLAVFALGAWVGAPFVHQPVDKEAKKSKDPPHSDTAEGITLGDALRIAEDKFATAGHLDGRTIGALWKANENGAEYIYADIWPPYQGESPPADNTQRLAIRVDQQGTAEWAWIEGTVLVTTETDQSPILVRSHTSSTIGSDGRRRVVLPPAPSSESPAQPKGRKSVILYPEGESGPTITIDGDGRVLSRQGPKSQ